MFFTAVLHISELNIFSLDSLGILFPIVAWTASILTFVYCLIIVFKTFLGENKQEKLDKSSYETPKGMLIAPIILGILVIGIFFIPNVIGNYLIHPAMVSIFSTVFLDEYL